MMRSLFSSVPEKEQRSSGRLFGKSFFSIANSDGRSISLQRSCPEASSLLHEDGRARERIIWAAFSKEEGGCLTSAATASAGESGCLTLLCNDRDCDHKHLCMHIDFTCACHVLVWEPRPCRDTLGIGDPSEQPASAVQGMRVVVNGMPFIGVLQMLC